MSVSFVPTAQPLQAGDRRMANLWIRLTKQFGARWASQYGDCDDGTWASALRGVDSQTLGQALGRVALSGSEFPPSLPEFLAICGRASGLPDAGTAYANACHNRWSHAVVYEAAKRVGIYELRTRAERDMMPKFREHYGAVCAAWMAGERFSVPGALRVTRQKPAACRPEVAAAHMAKLRQALGLQVGAA